MATLLWHIFASHCCHGVGTCDWEKFYNLIYFSCLHFTFYFILEKKKYFFTVSHELSATMFQVCQKNKNTKQRNQHCFTYVHLMLAHRATSDEALARLIVSLFLGYLCPVYITYFRHTNVTTHSEK